MTAHALLRAATRDAHDRVDAAFSAYDLTDDCDYAQFLAAHAAAFLPVEEALTDRGAEGLFPGWVVRRRGEALRADLAELGVAPLSPIAAPAFGGDAPLAGGAYVLEGSRLGGRLLATRVGPALPRRFLSASPTPDGGWRDFIALLERILYSDVERQVATASAVATFACFEQAACVGMGRR